MLRLIDILIILSEISAARAGPLRRYVNTTCTQEASDTMTGVAYQPYAGSPSLSLGPIQGITSLPFSQLIESPADASSTGPRSSQTDASSIAPTTRANPSLSQPPRTGSSGLAMSTSTTSVTKSDSIPTSFSTFGGQHADTTVTITTLSYTTVQAPPSAANSQSSQAVRSSQAQTDAIPTAFSTFGGKPADTTVTVTKTAYTTLSAAPHVAESQSSQNVHSSQAEDTTDTSADITVTKTTTTYTTFSVPPHVGASQSSQEVQSSQAKNTASTSATDSSPTFVYDPLPTATSDVITTSGTSTKATSSSSNAQHTDSTSELDNPQPLPSSLATTTSSAQSTQQNEDPEPSPTSSPDTVPPLPEVVNGNPSSTQATFNTTSSATTAPPGITIVPQNPSVIYITVTDAGATTTVTDSGDTKTANERWAMSTVIADWARGNPFERRAWHLGQR